MRTHWRVNLFGALVYVLLVGWLILACAARIVMDLNQGVDNAMPYVGMGMGAIGLIGIGFGREEHDNDE